MTNLSSSITPLWSCESWAFVGPVSKYIDLVLVLPTTRNQFTVIKLTGLNHQQEIYDKIGLTCSRTYDAIRSLYKRDIVHL